MEARRFEVTSEITGERYTVEFRWLQTAISLRGSDTVDVKFLVNDGAKVVAVPHGPLEQACRDTGVPLTDPLCRRIAERHIAEALRSDEDSAQEILTLTPERVGALVHAEAPRRRRE